MLSVHDLISHAAKKGLRAILYGGEGERDSEKGRWGRKVSLDWPLDGLDSMTRPFPRRLVARFTRPSISHFCRTQDTHLSCKHLSPPFPLPSRRRPISDPTSPSLPLGRRSRDGVWPNRSHAEWSFLPAHVRPASIGHVQRRRRARRTPWLRLQTTSAPVFSLRRVAHLEYIAATAIH